MIVSQLTWRKALCDTQVSLDANQSRSFEMGIAGRPPGQPLAQVQKRAEGAAYDSAREVGRLNTA